MDNQPERWSENTSMSYPHQFRLAPTTDPAKQIYEEGHQEQIARPRVGFGESLDKPERDTLLLKAFSQVPDSLPEEGTRPLEAFQESGDLPERATLPLRAFKKPSGVPEERTRLLEASRESADIPEKSNLPLKAFKKPLDIPEERTRLLEAIQKNADLPERATLSLKAFREIADYPERATLSIQVVKKVSEQQEGSPQAMKSEISGAASNGAIVGIGNIIGFLFKYGNNLIIQRALGAGLFGLYSVSLSLVTLIASIFDLGLDNAVIRYIAIYRGKKQMNSMRSLLIFCTATVGVTGALGALLVLFFAPSLAALIHRPDTAATLQIMAPLVPLLCMQTVWIGGLQGLKEFKKRVLVQRFLIPLLLLLLMIVALVYFRNITGVAIILFISTLISTVTNLYFLFSAISRISDAGQEKYEVRIWLGFALPNFLTTIVNTLLDSVDTLLLAFFVSAIEIGQYAAAIKISSFIVLPLTSL